MYTKNPHTPIFDDAGNCVGATDWLGNRFTVGDTVMYCIGAGRGQMMAIGKVLKIRHTPQLQEWWITPRNEEEQEASVLRKCWDMYAKAYVDKPQYRMTREWDEIQVQVLTSKTSGQWANKQRVRPAWVNPMNITALPQGWREVEKQDVVP